MNSTEDCYVYSTNPRWRKLLDLDLDLAVSRQGPRLRHHTDELCALWMEVRDEPTLEWCCRVSWPYVMDSGALFHSMIVRDANEYLNSLVFDLSVSSFLVLVSSPLAGRFEYWRLTSAIGKWPWSILYMNPSLWIRRLVSRGSRLSWFSMDVTLAVREYDDRIHLAAAVFALGRDFATFST